MGCITKSICKIMPSLFDSSTQDDSKLFLIIIHLKRFAVSDWLKAVSYRSEGMLAWKRGLIDGILAWKRGCISKIDHRSTSFSRRSRLAVYLRVN